MGKVHVRRPRLTGALIAASIAALAVALPAARGVSTRARAAAVHLVRIGSFDAPIYVSAPPGDTHRLFVVEKPGRVIVIVNGHRQSRPFLDISRSVQSSATEQGLLSAAFAPDYARSGRLYVCFTMFNNDVRVLEFRRSRSNPNVADPTSARIVLTVPHRYDNHNGGQLQFGPDGALYVGIGDGGSEYDPQNLGQNTDVLVGKVLRIVPGAGGGYSIPKGNPFRGRPAQRGEIWAYGLRNPWRFSFDRATGDLSIGDVGQDLEEEIDFARRGRGAGANYGWSIFEGFRRNKPGTASGAIFPELVTLHSDGNCAIIGGYVVRDRSLGSLYGRYLYGDNCNSQIRSAILRPGRARGDAPTGLAVSSLSSFGEDALGRIYAVSLGGPVYRLTG